MNIRVSLYVKSNWEFFVKTRAWISLGFKHIRKAKIVLLVFDACQYLAHLVRFDFAVTTTGDERVLLMNLLCSFL
jgi:hypothetical protein